MENHPFVQEQQKKIGDAITKYNMRQYTSCQEKWPTNQNIHPDLASFMCAQYVRETPDTKRFSNDNNMIPLTLVSGLVVELRDCMDVTPLDCMLVSLACPFMCVLAIKVEVWCIKVLLSTFFSTLIAFGDSIYSMAG